ncbi:uncharacterized protein METZ01_LOCUS458026, partial [marine metagenome]
MKRLWLILFLLLIVGCGSTAPPMDDDEWTLGFEEEYPDMVLGYGKARLNNVMHSKDLAETNARTDLASKLGTNRLGKDVGITVEVL